MSAFPVTPAHADLIATAYVKLVDAGADPQDIGMAALSDSLQGFQAGRLERFPVEWKAADEYRFTPSPNPVDLQSLEDAIALVSDTGRRFPLWDDTDTSRWLGELWERIEAPTAR